MECFRGVVFFNLNCIYWVVGFAVTFGFEIELRLVTQFV